MFLILLSEFFTQKLEIIVEKGDEYFFFFLVISVLPIRMEMNGGNRNACFGVL